MKPLLHIEDLSIDFQSEQRVTSAVRHISLTVERGEILALVGESGSGKSVTALSILQLLPRHSTRYSSGSILFSEDGEHVTNLLTLKEALLRQVRGKEIAMIFQEPMTSLNPVMTCGSQITEALLSHKKISRKEAKQRAINWMGRVQLPEPQILFHRYPHQLSGGQKQRVMIAMAMCCEPSLLICDEPTTALDVTVQKTILELIRSLQQELNMGVLFITHDLGIVKEIADRVAILYKGELVEFNNTNEIFNHPVHPYTKALIACRPAAQSKGAPLPMVSDFLGTSATTPKAIAIPKAMSNEAIVKVKDLVIQFPAKSSLFGRATSFYKAVNGVSFSVYEGETLGLVGESGCGKTTLGRSLLGLAQPASGHIYYKDKDLTKLDRKLMGEMRKDVQLVFQDPYSSLNPRLTIGSALAEPLANSGIVRDERGRRKRVSELLDKVGLPATAASRYPHEFSGGQRQRIVIARALSLDPQFLVCDESVSALDVSVQAQVLNLLNDLKRDLGLTMLFISHDLSVVRYMSDRIMVMQAGKIVETGDSETVYLQPQHPYTKRLLDAVPNL